MQLSRANVFWRWQPPPAAPAFALGADRPTGRSYSFVRADLPDDRCSAVVSYDAASQSGAPNVGVFSQQARPPVAPDRVDLVRAFQRVEESGGRELRQAWERARRPWSADASTAAADGATVVNVFYIAQDAGERAQFRYDPRTDIVTRQ